MFWRFLSLCQVKTSITMTSFEQELDLAKLLFQLELGGGEAKQQVWEEFVCLSVFVLVDACRFLCVPLSLSLCMSLSVFLDLYVYQPLFYLALLYSCCRITSICVVSQLFLHSFINCSSSVCLYVRVFTVLCHCVACSSSRFPPRIRSSFAFLPSRIRSSFYLSLLSLYFFHLLISLVHSFVRLLVHSASLSLTHSLTHAHTNTLSPLTFA